MNDFDSQIEILMPTEMYTNERKGDEKKNNTQNWPMDFNAIDRCC